MTQSASTQTGVSNQSSAKNFLESLLARFPERSRAIFGLRFGLADGQEKTLEEIGHSYGITRERVRQVVDVQLKKMRTELSGKQTHPALQRILVLLNEHHGILTVQQLKTMLAGDDLREGQALLALLALIPGIVVNKETKDEHEYVRVIDFDMKRWHQVIEVSMTALKAEGDAVDFARLYAIVSAGSQVRRHSMKLSSKIYWLQRKKLKKMFLADTDWLCGRVFGLGVPVSELISY
ncbi:MAG: hypothetical protein E6P95_02755 [Candidatus Moraniibacteriota bacterium]|nr:MAG: hypothetical protein E6P95_02755 [Candidatus Moranbacteria bacterium]